MLREDFIQLMFGYFSGSSKTLFELYVNAKPESITPIQYNIMEYLYFNNHKNLSEISDCMYLSMPNASREVKKLIE
jgi:DNA-binding MarR family transcriptional regulator